MTIANVSLNNTFDEWRTVTNQVISFVNEVDSQQLFNVVSNSAVLTTAPKVARNDTLYLKINVSSDITDSSTLNLATANAVSNVYNKLSSSISTTDSKAVAAFGFANTVNTGMVASFATGNLAYSQANTARDQADTARDQANTAYTAANNANSYAQAALGATTVAVSAFSQANDAYTAANNANGYAQAALSVNTVVFQGYDQANTARTHANAAFLTANSSYDQANTARVHANASFTQANLVFGAANTARDQANSAYAQANLVFGVANTGWSQANAAYTQANLIFGSANSGWSQANVAYAQANAAYSKANTGLANTSGVSFNGNLTIPGILGLVQYTESLYAPASGTSFTVDLANGTIQKFTSSGNIDITLPSSVAGKSFLIGIAFGGNHAVTFLGGSTIKWNGGTAPNIGTPASGKFAWYAFVQDGTNTYGNVFMEDV